MGNQPYPKGTMTPAQEKAFIERQAKTGNQKIQLEKTMKDRKPTNTSKAVKKAKGGKVSSGYKCSHNRLY